MAAKVVGRLLVQVFRIIKLRLSRFYNVLNHSRWKAIFIVLLAIALLYLVLEVCNRTIVSKIEGYSRKGKFNVQTARVISNGALEAEEEERNNRNVNKTLSKATRNFYTHLTYKENSEIIDILFQFINAKANTKMITNLRVMLKSILDRTNTTLRFNIITDTDSRRVSEDVFRELLPQNKQHMNTKVNHYNIQDLVKAVNSTTSRLQKFFSSGNANDYYNKDLFMLPAAMQLALPTTIDKLIMLDTDIQVRADIKNLYALFESMSPSNVLGLAREQQPTYRHSTYTYRKLNPNTKVGGPPPNGLTGYNSGVKLMNLKSMRTSKLYNEYLTEKRVQELITKYSFSGHLGDQDLFTLVSFEDVSLFYTLPCQWNRQLCTWWRDNGYSDVFALYNDCQPPIYVYHGNCDTQIPE